MRVRINFQKKWIFIPFLLVALYLSYQVIPSLISRIKTVPFHTLSPYQKRRYLVKQLTNHEKFPYIVDVTKSFKAGFRFCAIGDSGSGSTEQYKIADKMFDAKPGFILHTGDLAYTYGLKKKFEERFIKVYRRFFLKKIRFYPALGNHDYFFDEGKAFFPFFSYLPNRYYQLRTGLADFFALDSNTLSQDKGLDPDQIRWLESRLEKSDRKWKIAFFHHPVFSSGEHGGSPLMKGDLKRVLEKYGVNLVVSGHDHDYERLKVIKGIRYLVSGGGGREVRPQKTLNHPFSEKFLSRHHFLMVDVGRAKLDIQVKDESGKLLDRFQVKDPKKTANFLKPE